MRATVMAAFCLFTLGLAFDLRGEDVDILLEEMYTIGTSGLSMYDAEHAVRNGTTCTDNTEEMIYYASHTSCPQTCETAVITIPPTFTNSVGVNLPLPKLPLARVSPNKDIPLDAPIAEDAIFESLVVEEGRFINGPFTYVTNNRRGALELDSFWATGSGDVTKKVKLKIFKVEFDNRRIGLPKKYWKAPRVRYYAFEVSSIPADQTVTDYAIIKSTVHTNRQYSGSFTLNGSTVHVATQKQLFK